MPRLVLYHFDVWKVALVNHGDNFGLWLRKRKLMIDSLTQRITAFAAARVLLRLAIADKFVIVCKSWLGLSRKDVRC